MVEPSATLDDALAPLLREPARAAVLCDLDGTLAPIVARPEETAVPAAVRIALARISNRCALTAIISGRRAIDANRIVGLEKITYVGNHGLEVLYPNAPDPTALVELGAAATAAASFVDDFVYGRLPDAGLRREDKGPIVALHWREAPDEPLAEAIVGQIAAEAERAGLAIHRGRKVIELRPAVRFDKGQAAAALLDSADADVALYAGDDRTDLDAFAELAARRERGTLTAAVCVGVRSDEGPEELASKADLLVDGPEGMLAVLKALSG